MPDRGLATVANSIVRSMITIQINLSESGNNFLLLIVEAIYYLTSTLKNRFLTQFL